MVWLDWTWCQKNRCLLNSTVGGNTDGEMVFPSFFASGFTPEQTGERNVNRKEN